MNPPNPKQTAFCFSPTLNAAGAPAAKTTLQS